ncbi:MAG: hypothetical protein ACK52C_02425, partial [Planctomycetia bacterium]
MENPGSLGRERYQTPPRSTNAKKKTWASSPVGFSCTSVALVRGCPCPSRSQDDAPQVHDGDARFR